MPRLYALAAILAAVAGPALGQDPTLRPGQSVAGELTASDRTLRDGSHYDCFVVPTRQGQRLQIDQTSDAFDSYLTVGLGDCTALADSESDDDGGGGLNSRLVHVGDGRGLTIRVNSLEAAKTGAYRVSVAELSDGPTTPGNRSVPPAAPAEGSETLAQESCPRLGEFIVGFHEFRASNHRLAVSLGRQGSPEIARLQPRIDRVSAWLTANGYSPSNPREAVGILRRTSPLDQLTEFEQRCSR